MKIETFNTMSQPRLKQILSDMKKVKLGFVGDICIDIYWFADMRLSELSRETPHYPLPIVEERYQLGAGGNVLANLSALGLQKILAVSAIGDDWRGTLVKQELAKLGIDNGYITQRSNSVTNAYCKPIKIGLSSVMAESARIDFTSEPIDEATENLIAKNVVEMANQVDVICVSDQFSNGIVTEKVKKVLEGLSGKTIIVDSRDRIGSYQNAILKPNEIELVKAASKITGVSAEKYTQKGVDGLIEAAQVLSERKNCHVSATLGPEGNMQITSQSAFHIPSKPVSPPLDICGAGDSFLSAYSAALAAGASACECGYIGNLASGVTIKKLNCTGSATSEEILQEYLR